jgi:penicillin-binding protein 2
MSSLERLRPSEPRSPVSPQLALRVALIGGLALVMFGLIFFRLWYLQVLSGDQYVQEANANGRRPISIAAPRGQILDRSGVPLVTDHVTNAVQIVPGSLPKVVLGQVAKYQKALAVSEQATVAAGVRLKRLQVELTPSHRHATATQRHELRVLAREAEHVRPVPVPPLPATAVSTRRLFDRLGGVIGLRASTIEQRVIQGIAVMPYANVTVKTDAGRGALTVLAERHNEFPGVTQQPVSISAYPDRNLAAQVLGYVGQVSETELTKPAFRGVKEGTVVGQTGLEYYYDRYLRGKPGIQRIQVNASGQPQPPSVPLPTTEPISGYDLKLTLDLKLQQEGEKALTETIGGGTGDAGAFVALDPRNGAVLAMGSTPSYDPNVFARPLSESEYDSLIGSNATGGVPGGLFNRAAAGGYPTGSTFKPITAMAALQAGLITPGTTMGGGQCAHIGNECLYNAGHVDLGDQNLISAIKISEDTYFYEVGQIANNSPVDHGQSIQRMARELGLGHPTGIDLPEEQPGIVPDPAWREHQNSLERACERRRHIPYCGIVGEVRPWSEGDNVNLAVGQGDLLASPLQMAVAYSTLANAYMHEGNGTVVRPHLGMELDDPQGRLIRALSAKPIRHVHLNYGDLQAVMTGLREAASEAGGTSEDVWQGFGRAVYGKTGTAQHNNESDQGWYLCYLPDAKRPIVLAVTVERGGFGDASAAPIARLMASEWFGKSEKLVHGSNTDE